MTDGRVPGTLQPADAFLRHRRGGPAPAARQPRDAVRLRRPGHRAGQRPGPRRRRPSAPRSTAISSRRSNLQRQVLFDEHDVAENLPKAEAAARKLGAINSSVHVEPVVTDIDRTNILELVEDADLILDGTDNFEIRYLINDVAVKLGKPWVYGGCIGSHGQTMTILPGETPCLRCVFEAAPAPGEAGTCETAGVLGPIVNIIASFQATEALKILTGQLRHGQPRADLHRRLGERAAPDQDRAAAGQGRLSVLPAPAASSGWTASTARRRPACAAATPCRCRTASPAQAQLRGDGPPPGDAGRGELQPLPAEVQRRRATSSRCSPTAGRSSRGPTTWTRRGRCTRSMSGIERYIKTGARYTVQESRGKADDSNARLTDEQISNRATSAARKVQVCDPARTNRLEARTTSDHLRTMPRPRGGSRPPAQ